MPLTRNETQQIRERVRKLIQDGDKLMAGAGDDAEKLTGEGANRMSSILGELDGLSLRLGKPLGDFVTFQEKRGELTRFEQPAEYPSDESDFEAESHARPLREDRTQYHGWPVEEADQFFSALIYQTRSHQIPGFLHPDLAETFARGPRPERHATPSGQSLYDLESGAVLLPQTISATILRKLHSEGSILSRVRQVPITIGKTATWPAVKEDSRVAGSRYGGFTVSRTAESGAAQGSKIKLNAINLELKKQTGLVYLTEEQVEDTPQLQTLIDDLVPNAFNFEIERELLTGAGAHEFLGLLNSGAKIAVAAESSQTGGSAATVLYENLTNMEARMFAGSMANSVVFAHQTCLPTLRKMYIAVGTGGIPVYLPASGVAGAPFGTLMGKPLIVSEHCNPVGTEGDIIWVDLGQYLYAFKGRLRTTQSIHVKFVEGEIALRFMLRNDGKPWWHSALTLPDGSTTVSPIITLATRS